MHNTSTAAGCANVRKIRETGHFVSFGETGDSADKFIFYARHNIAIDKEICYVALNVKIQ